MSQSKPSETLSLNQQMRAAVNGLRGAGFDDSANWLDRAYFGDEPPLDTGIAWCVWYSRNHDVTNDEAFAEWKRRTGEDTSDHKHDFEWVGGHGTPYGPTEPERVCKTCGWVDQDD